MSLRARHHLLYKRLICLLLDEIRLVVWSVVGEFCMCGRFKGIVDMACHYTSVMEKFSTFYPNGEGISANELNRSNRDLDLTKYMDIDEFIQVLQETDRITPFGRLKAEANVNLDDVNTVKWFSHQMEQPGFNQSKKKKIPLTSSVLQVIEMDRKLRDMDTKSNVLPLYSPEQTQEILDDCALTNYLVQLLSDKGNSS